MHCTNCGKKISDDKNFCESCGHHFVKVESEEIENLISINVSKNQTLVFYNNFFIYKGARINYKDIDGISYLLTRKKYSINFIPIYRSTAFKATLEANGQKYEVDSSAASFMRFKRQKENTFNTLMYVLDSLIKPFVLINQLIKYGKENELKIADSLTVNSKGFFKKRFWRSPEFLPWDQYYNSVLHQGNFYIYKSDPSKKYKLYFACSMSVMNAPVFPELLNTLFQSSGIIDQEEMKDLEKKKDEIIVNNKIKDSSKKFCRSCSAPNEAGQKCCRHCGSALL